MNATEIGAHVAALVTRYGHLDMAAASALAVAGYGDAGARAAATRENQLPLRQLAVPEGEIRVSPELRDELKHLRRAIGHQTFYLAMATLAAGYAFRGGRGMEADALEDPERCPSCRERLAAADRLKQTLDRARNNRPQGAPAAGAEEG